MYIYIYIYICVRVCVCVCVYVCVCVCVYKSYQFMSGNIHGRCVREDRHDISYNSTDRVAMGDLYRRKIHYR